MLELAPHHYERVVALIQASGMKTHLALPYEVVEGRRQGQIFVDDAANPRTALVCGYSGFCFGFGDPDEDLIQEVVAAFWDTPLMRQNYGCLFGSHYAWEAPLKRIFAGFEGAVALSRLGFELRQWPPPPEIPPGFRLEPITLAVAQAIVDGVQTDHFGLDPWFIRVEGGPEAYAALGLGLVLTTDDVSQSGYGQSGYEQEDNSQDGYNQDSNSLEGCSQDGYIVAMAGICGLGHGEAELEVGTIPAYRGRGLGRLVSAAFMQQCQEHGLEPAYSCGSSNLPSVSVAHKLGYEEIEEIHGFALAPYQT